MSMKKRGSMTDKGWFGSGLYFSQHADYTIMYSIGEVDPKSKKYKVAKVGNHLSIIEFDITPGRIAEIDRAMIGAECTPSFDSHVTANKFELVIFDSNRVLPRYIIEFDVVRSAGSKFDGSVEQLGPTHKGNGGSGVGEGLSDMD